MSGALLLQIKGAISEMPEEHQVKIKECVEKLKSVLEEYDEVVGPMSMAFIGAEATGQ